MLKVIKSSEKKELFKRDKLKEGLIKAFSDSDVELNLDLVDDIISTTEQNLNVLAKDDEIESSIIRDTLLYVLNSHSSGLRKVANSYKRYDKKKEKQKEMQAILEILSNEETDEKNENSNINGYAYMGKMLHVGEETNKVHTKEFLMNPEHTKAHNEGFFYAHDLGFYSLGLSNCLSIDVKPLLEKGFYAGHGFLRSPGNISTAMMQAAIIMQSSQNNFFGGQAIANIDYAMAPYIIKTFNKECSKYFDYVKGKKKTFDFKSLEDAKKSLPKKHYEKILSEVKNIAFQAAEGFVHNMSNLESRCGSQQVFSSITLGMDTTPEGRMVTEALIEAQLKGLGHHETAIFPICIFLIKDGVNFKKGDLNYDLYRKAMYCSAKRLWPSYVFLDAPQNLEFYKDGDPYSYAQAMGKCKCSPCKIVMNPVYSGGV